MVEEEGIVINGQDKHLTCSRNHFNCTKRTTNSTSFVYKKQQTILNCIENTTNKQWRETVTEEKRGRYEVTAQATLQLYIKTTNNILKVHNNILTVHNNNKQWAEQTP